MKKLVLMLMVCAAGVKAQSFHRAAVVLQAGGGIDAYKTEQKYSPVTGRPDTSITSNAASANLYGGLEFGLGRHIGLGARGRMNTFFRDVDDVVRQRTSVNTADMLFCVNLHPIVRRKLDLLLGAEAGISNIDLSFSDSPKNITSGRGSYASLYIEPRIYKKRFGFHIRASLPFAQYKNMNTISESLSQQKYAMSGWKGSGFAISAGLQVRLF